ncbi:MAG: branched-chain amino acid ABC transporter permease [Arenicellales bacterium]|jgi:branched-chain amino acid transport system permease protein|nr:branched-chain amino acid ABC transporter permease [Arenicellales bacterium]HJP45581.1 branched-chain amino acid ABC transporter permease [Arenicellales bacterium]|tara:strand:+ start:273 stop:1178 length:906 start_codon:yes stop_codon:yes gene_type:complete
MLNDYLLTVISNIGMISLIALSAYLLLISGEISFGQQAYFGISAYAGAIATTLWGWPLWLALLFGSSLAALAAGFVGLLTLRISGLYFSIATLAFAEMVRLSLFKLSYQLEIDGELIGPNGAEGFGEIRWIFDNDVSVLEYTLLIYGILLLVLFCLVLIERSRLGMIFRMLGQDPLLTRIQGLNPVRYKVTAAILAGFIAGLGGTLYAHSFTYIEPQIFNVMLGVHALAYGLIGGLGTVLGPLIGVAIDIGFLESVRVFQGYRMIVFGGLVALMLIFMPRGILDENRVYRLKNLAQRWFRA